MIYFRILRLLLIIRIVFKMSYLMEVSEVLNFTEINATSTFLSTVYLLAIATHPSLPSLLYALYGSSYLDGIYNYYVLQTWNTERTGQTLLFNTTIEDLIICTTDLCNMEVSDKMLVIQDGNGIYLYQLNSTNKGADQTTAVFNYTKSFSIDPSFKQSSLLSDNLFYYNSSHLLIYQHKTTPNYFAYRLKISSSFVGMTSTKAYLIFGFNSSYMDVGYLCSECLVNGTFTNNSNLTSNPSTGEIGYRVIDSNVSLAGVVYMHQGFNDEGVAVLWITANGVGYQYKITASSSSLVQKLNSSEIVLASANDKTAVFYENGSFSFRGFSTQPNASVFYSYISNNDKAITAINADTSMLSVLSPLISNNQTIKQYQIVSSCSSYQAIYNQTLNICSCFKYDGIYCAAAVNSNDSSGSSGFPVAYVGAGVGGAVVVAILVWVLYKKVLVKIGKPERVPYKYTPVQLMSFEM